MNRINTEGKNVFVFWLKILTNKSLITAAAETNTNQITPFAQQWKLKKFIGEAYKQYQNWTQDQLQNAKRLKKKKE